MTGRSGHPAVKEPLGAKPTLLPAPDFFSYWLPPVLWCAVVLFFSGDVGSGRHTLRLVQWLLSWFPPVSPAQVKLVHFYLRKGGHILAYGVLYFLWFRALQGNLYYRPQKAFLWALGLSLLLALVDEGRQSLTPNRSGSIRDVGLDLGASLLAAWLTRIFWQPRRRPGQALGNMATGPGAAR